jgi:uncharacterized membrane protein YphA (DoxX/SURF4 family)
VIFMPKFLSAESEPLRRYLYGVGVVILGLLVVLGVLTDEVAFAVGAVLSAALLVPAVEVARSKVTPTEDYVAEHGAP